MQETPISVLVADDDEDDRLLVRDAWKRHRLASELRFVAGGDELLDYLLRRGDYADPAESPRPDLVLLDCNMPGKDGPSALAELKGDPGLRRIPVVVMTADETHESIRRCYELGANSYVLKPFSFAELAEKLRVLGDYWFEIVSLPRGQAGGDMATKGDPDVCG